MQAVYRAEAYRSGAMGSLGNASYMLIRQYQFPNEYDPDKDKMEDWDHDRILQNDYDHFRRCFMEHTGTSEGGLEYWVRREDQEKVIAFLRDILKADPNISWTGFRIIGTVKGNGCPVWKLQLFAKHPESQTQVFDTETVPGLINGSRYARR